VVYFEIGCKDTVRSGAFYAELFGWKTKAHSPMRTELDPADKGISGHLVALGHEPHNYVMVYVEVDNLERYLASAEALGGKKVIGPIDIPTGRFAWFTDPEGNQIGLLEPKQP
jgi:predicted enzyme related to lactoylglutathione lyase